MDEQTTKSELNTPEASKIFAEIWSPYCKGVSLLECPSSQAEKLRDDVRALLRDGKSSDEVVSMMLIKHGELLRMKPDTFGREASAYWLPWLLFLLAVVTVVTFWFRRKKSASKRNTPKQEIPIATGSPSSNEILRDLKEI